MPRIRTIKPEFWRSPSTAKASPWARLLYIAMWNWADDYGRAEWTPRELLGFAFPHDEEPPCTSEDFPSLLKEVADVFGVTFFVNNERRFYEIPSWFCHQKTERRANPTTPTFDDPESTPDMQIHTKRGNTLQAQGSSSPGKGTGEKEREQLITNDHFVDNDDQAHEKPVDMFNDFWAAYPRKHGKAQARKAWARATKRAPQERIIDGATAYRDDPNRLPEFTKHASTWLNNDCWDDPPLPARGRQMPAGDQRIQDEMANAQAYDARQQPARDQQFSLILGGQQHAIGN